jgi:hypothetical protein
VRSGRRLNDIVAPGWGSCRKGRDRPEPGRNLDLARSFGADLDALEIVVAKRVPEAKKEGCRAVATEKSELRSFFMNDDGYAIHASGPDGAASLNCLRLLGPTHTKSSEAGAFWETPSVEQALKCPGAIICDENSRRLSDCRRIARAADDRIETSSHDRAGLGVGVEQGFHRQLSGRPNVPALDSGTTCGPQKRSCDRSGPGGGQAGFDHYRRPGAMTGAGSCLGFDASVTSRHRWM